MIWAQVLIVAWLLGLLGLRSRLLAIGIALLALIPLHEGLSVARALRGLWGDPSVTTLQLLLLALVGAKLPDLRYGYRVPMFIAATGLLLLVSALGPWNIDLYRFGFQPAALLAIAGLLALATWWRGQALYLWLLAIDVLAWRAGWLESTNLWDYLFDPLLTLSMLALAIRNGYRAHQNRTLLLAKS